MLSLKLHHLRHNIIHSFPLFFSSSYQYDLFVIGGGSGGLAASKQAAKLNKRIGLADFVKPTLKGTQWGLGGTCVNVGCIPKKMFHHAGLLYENLPTYKLIGYNKPLTQSNDWNILTENIQNHIKSLNYGYRLQLNEKNIVYYNKYAKFINNHSIELTDNENKKEIITAENIIIATGGRPKYLDVPGAKEHCITSNDLFSLSKPPGKTLIVGASYISLECGGFLNSLGYDTSIMARSILLRGFDQKMANKIGNVLTKRGVNFINSSIPTSFTNTSNGQIEVEAINLSTKNKFKSQYDTVLLAIGRQPNSNNINLESIGVQIDEKTNKIIVNDSDMTNITNIYAIGDCAHGRPELTPPAVMAGKLLVDRLYTQSKKLMNYDNIPTTVFTPIEYGSCGLSEENAINRYGKAIKVYHAEFTPIEWKFDSEKEAETCYIKVIVNTNDNNRVIGFHILCPNAGEITQGVSIAMNCGLIKSTLDSSIGIHPTIAEEMIGLDVTNDQGDGKKTGC